LAATLYIEVKGKICGRMTNKAKKYGCATIQILLNTLEQRRAANEKKRKSCLYLQVGKEQKTLKNGDSGTVPPNQAGPQDQLFH
jgi:hypothetical protein